MFIERSNSWVDLGIRHNEELIVKDVVRNLEDALNTRTGNSLLDLNYGFEHNAGTNVSKSTVERFGVEQILKNVRLAEPRLSNFCIVHSIFSLINQKIVCRGIGSLRYGDIDINIELKIEQYFNGLASVSVEKVPKY